MVYKIPRKKPWHNGVCERFHRTLRREILNRVIVYDQLQVQKLTGNFKNYYNEQRPHQGLGGATPRAKILQFPRQKKKVSPIVYRERVLLDGLITKFELAA